MDPNFQLLLDEMAKLNRRFDEQDASWNRRFRDLEHGLTKRSTSVDARLAAVESSASDVAVAFNRRLATLESLPVDPRAPAVESRLATLEANYTNSDVEFTQRLSELEAIRVSHIADKRDGRVASLEVATHTLAS